MVTVHDNVRLAAGKVLAASNARPERHAWKDEPAAEPAELRIAREIPRRSDDLAVGTAVVDEAAVPAVPPSLTRTVNIRRGIRVAVVEPAYRGQAPAGA